MVLGISLSTLRHLAPALPPSTNHYHCPVWRLSLGQDEAEITVKIKILQNLKLLRLGTTDHGRIEQETFLCVISVAIYSSNRLYSTFEMHRRERKIFVWLLLRGQYCALIGQGKHCDVDREMRLAKRHGRWWLLTGLFTVAGEARRDVSAPARPPPRWPLLLTAHNGTCRKQFTSICWYVGGCRPAAQIYKRLWLRPEHTWCLTAILHDVWC